MHHFLYCFTGNMLKRGYKNLKCSHTANRSRVCFYNVYNENWPGHNTNSKGVFNKTIQKIYANLNVIVFGAQLQNVC